MPTLVSHLLPGCGKMIPAYYSCTFTVRYTPTRFTRPVVPILSGVPNSRLNVWSMRWHPCLQGIGELSMRPGPARQLHRVRLRLTSSVLFLLPLFVLAVPGNCQQPALQK